MFDFYAQFLSDMQSVLTALHFCNKDNLLEKKHLKSQLNKIMEDDHIQRQHLGLRLTTPQLRP